MELELYFLQPICNVIIIDTTDENFPSVCMVWWNPSRPIIWVEGYCLRSVDCGLIRRHTMTIRSKIELY